jgi:ribosomal protein L2
MSVRKLKPITPGQRFRVVNGYDITTDKPERSLIAPIKNSGDSQKDDHALYGWWSQAEISYH